MSAETRNEACSARCRAPSAPSASALVTRWMQSIISGPPAPAADEDPTSSLSNSATPRTAPSPASAASLPQVAISASRLAKQLARLSSRPMKMNSSFAPPMVPGCVSHTLSSKSTISSGESSPSCSASSCSSRGGCLPSPSAGLPALAAASSDGAAPATASGVSSADAACAAGAPVPVGPLSACCLPGACTHVLMAVARMGERWFWLLGLNPSVPSARFRWMASMGMRRIGFSILTNRWRRAPEGVRTSTRPATDRSRSNQVCHRPPPYGSTFTLSHALFLTSLLTGFSFRHGLSVCAPIRWKPLPGW
mmetsp:Transcript_20396/g.61444  ORF Transcript_20396/g.61444 Transcript_20396/m.61444 type:complete len:308 (+) Transcript_20396:219-1142(+)